MIIKEYNSKERGSSYGTERNIKSEIGATVNIYSSSIE